MRFKHIQIQTSMGVWLCIKFYLTVNTFIYIYVYIDISLSLTFSGEIVPLGGTMQVYMGILSWVSLLGEDTTDDFIICTTLFTLCRSSVLSVLLSSSSFFSIASFLLSLRRKSNFCRETDSQNYLPILQTHTPSKVFYLLM